MVPGLLKAISNWQWLLCLLFFHLPKLLLCCLHQQNVFLSQSHISLGNIPVQSKCSRLLFLNNSSPNETIVFAWQLKPLDFGEVRAPVPTDSEPPAEFQTYPLVPSHPTPSYSFPSLHPIPLHPIPSHLIPLHLCEAPETLSPNQQVSVSPMKGKVAPEETIPFVVTLKASVQAGFYSMDLVCEVGSSPERS